MLSRLGRIGANPNNRGKLYESQPLSMSTLVDHQLRQWATLNKGLEPYAPTLVNPASVNLRVGDTLVIESPSGSTYEVDISGCTKAAPFLVDPGEWILAHTAEIVTLPRNMEAEVCLRSSAARAGWQHALAGYVDPGWSGRLTLEFQNVRRFAALPIYSGIQLCQLRVSKLSTLPSQGYDETGRYMGDLSVNTNQDLTLS